MDFFRKTAPMTQAHKLYDELQWQHPHRLTAGVDEAGRGPLAGRVVAAAVILDPQSRIAGLADSKLLKAAQREQLFNIIKTSALAWAVGYAEVAEIEQLNILQATLLAMQRAVLALHTLPCCVLVDGTHCPILPSNCSTQAIIKGDQKIAAISAASIIAKVIRDQEMQQLDKEYPAYGFAQHKGYGTIVHRLALAKLGPCPAHRRTFRGVVIPGPSEIEVA